MYYLRMTNISIMPPEDYINPQVFQWISVKYSLPDNNREVLLAVQQTFKNDNPRNYVTIGIYYIIGIYSGWSEEKCGENCQVLYWAEKPKFPANLF